MGNPYLAAAEDEEEGGDAAGAVAEEAEAGSEDDFSDEGREFRKRYRLAEQPRGPDEGGPGTWRGKNFRWNRGGLHEPRRRLGMTKLVSFPVSLLGLSLAGPLLARQLAWPASHRRPGLILASPP